MNARPGDSFLPPLHLAEAGAWMAYSDWLQEQGRPYQKAARIAKGLERSNRLILVGQVPRLADPRISDEGDRGIAPRTGHLWKEHWALRWWTERAFRLRVRHDQLFLIDTIPLLLAQPSDFLDLIATRRVLAWQFFWKVARPIKRSTLT